MPQNSSDFVIGKTTHNVEKNQCRVRKEKVQASAHPIVENDVEGLFRSNFFFDFDTVALSFLFDKHCLIIE